MKNLYFRSLGIITLKTLAMTTVLLVEFIFFAQNIPSRVHALVMTVISFLLTFLFGEWIFSNPRVTPRQFVVVVIITFVWDVLFGMLLWGFILSDPSVWGIGNPVALLLPFVLHAAALGAALYDRKRLGPGHHHLAEGLL